MKLDVYAGMLGAGKTTLIKQMLLTAYQGKKVAIIENEVGKVNLDSAELESASFAVKEITSGCICCTLRGDFTRAITQLQEAEHPDYIIIEPSGVADLPEVIKACVAAPSVTLNRQIMVVNSRRIATLLKVSGEFLFAQLRATGTVFFNFTELVSSESIEETEKALLEVNPALKFVTVPLDQVTSETFPEVDELDENTLKEMPVYEAMVESAEQQSGKMPLNWNSTELAAADYLGNTSAKMKNASRSTGKNTLRIRVDPDAAEDTWYYRFTGAFDDDTLEKLAAILKDSDAPEIWRVKAYLKKTNGKVQKFDYVYGDFFQSELEEFDQEKQNILVVIGKAMQTKWLKQQCSQLDGELEH